MENKKNESAESEEIDFVIVLKKCVQILKEFWGKRLFFFIWLCLGIIAWVIVVVTTPTEYTSQVKLLPEYITVLQSNNDDNSRNARGIPADLYSDIVYSLPFLNELMSHQVVTVEGDSIGNLFTFLEKHQQQSCFSHVKKVPSKVKNVLKRLFSDEEVATSSKIMNANIEALTPNQTAVFNALKNRIIVSCEKGIVVLIEVKMQDPQIAFSLTKLITANLNKYISNYSAQKMNKDLAFIQERYNEARSQYNQIQEKYAALQAKEAAKNQIESLRIELESATNYYNNNKILLETAKIKVQEQTLSHIILSPATQPINSDNNNYCKKLIFCILSVLLVSSAYRIFRDKHYRIFYQD